MIVQKIKDSLRPIYPLSKTSRIRKKEFRNFKRLLRNQKNLPIKIVIGSGQKFTDDWIPSEAHFLDLLKVENWSRYFEKDSLEGLLAEHVWEHLTLEQGKKAATTCHMFLKKGRRLRVAVPDGFHPNRDYIEYVKPGGHGAGADDHKVLYNYQTFSTLFSEKGFDIELIEYFDEHGKFHAKDWTTNDGYIQRSLRYDERNSGGQPNYTSLILDAFKR